MWLTMTNLAPAPAPTKLQRPFSLFRDITNSNYDSLLRVRLREWGFSSKAVFILCFFIIVCGVAGFFLEGRSVLSIPLHPEVAKSFAFRNSRQLLRCTWQILTTMTMTLLFVAPSSRLSASSYHASFLSSLYCRRLRRGLSCRSGY